MEKTSTEQLHIILLQPYTKRFPLGLFSYIPYSTPSFIIPKNVEARTGTNVHILFLKAIGLPVDENREK